MDPAGDRAASCRIPRQALGGAVQLAGRGACSCAAQASSRRRGRGRAQAPAAAAAAAFDLSPSSSRPTSTSTSCARTGPRRSSATKSDAYNRIKLFREHPGESRFAGVGHIKSNILMLGPTGAGKTYPSS